jgi:hypothetical protein
MEKRIEDYLNFMVNDFCIGNDNEYDEGTLMEFIFEEIEKGDLDNYDEENVKLFYEVRGYILGAKEVKCKCGPLENIEYIFVVENDNIVCRWIEPKWNN